MTTESEIPDNKKIQNRSSAIGNYVTVIIFASIYVMASHPNTTSLNLTAALDDMITFVPTVLGTILIPAIVSALIAIFGKKKFSNVLAWSTVIICILSYIGRSFN